MIKNNNFIFSILTKEDLEIIAEAITIEEKLTSGEIRVSVKQKRSLFQNKKSLRDVAIKEFNRLKMHKTRDRNGILLLLILSEKRFYILPDVGISKILPQSTWDNIAKTTENHFKAGNFRSGILNVIRECGSILKIHFPIKPDDKNELDNSVALS